MVVGTAVVRALTGAAPPCLVAALFEVQPSSIRPTPNCWSWLCWQNIRLVVFAQALTNKRRARIHTSMKRVGRGGREGKGAGGEREKKLDPSAGLSSITE